MKQVGPSDKKILKDAGIRSGWGEEGYSLYERITIRPTINVNGIIGGYQGPKVKAVIPSEVKVKLDFRLVPNQDPYRIEQVFRRYIEFISPSTVSTSIKRNFIAEPVILKLSDDLINAAMIAYQQGFGKKAVFLRSGGTLPVVNLLQRVLKIPVVLMGFGLPDDGIHGPDEKFYLPNFFKGILTSIYFLYEISRSKFSN